MCTPFSGRGYRRKKLIPVAFLLTIALLNRTAEAISALVLNVSVNGDTTGAATGLFQNFAKLDVQRAPTGTGGQILYSLSVPDTLGATYLQLSTCVGSTYDTYLAMLDKNPGSANDTKVLAESGNDFKCTGAHSRAFLSVSLNPGTYFVLVTGIENKAGGFNLTVTATPATPTPLPWGLDRVDQRRLPTNGEYNIKDATKGTRIYLIDSGVRVTHSEFEGRAEYGYDFVNYRAGTAEDCTGHGTHAAGIMIGKNYGIAKNAKLIAVRVFDCNNNAKLADIIDAISWAAIDAQEHTTEKSIIAMMFSTKSQPSSLLRSTIRYLTGTGIPIIVPSGDKGQNACDFYPGSLDNFLTVGATDHLDGRSTFSNYGSCNSLYAPGTDIPSAWHTSDTSWRTFSGTRQAAAHMTGIMAHLITLNKGIKAELANNIIKSISTPDVVTNVLGNETTRLAYLRTVPPFHGEPPPSKNVYLFSVLSFIGFGSCSEAQTIFDSLKHYFEKKLSVDEHDIIISCPYIQPSITRADNLTAEVRFTVPERRATLEFGRLEIELNAGKRKLEDDLGFTFSVVEEPWVVDSTRSVFWGAPSFSDVESNSLSGGKIAGILVGCFCILTVIATAAWLIHRKANRIDEVESMQGSADFEKGPVHFDDFDHTEGNSSVMRSFRNMVKSMSFRRTGSQQVGANDTGINRMASYIGGPKAQVGKDVVRMESFGPEAFAGMTNSSTRNLSVALGSEKSMSSIGGASFRGLNNLVLSQDNVLNQDNMGYGGQDDSTSGSESNPIQEDMRMRSLGGEAFAMVGERLASVRAESYRPQADAVLPESVTEQDVRTESFGAEVLANNVTEMRDQSFFGGHDSVVLAMEE